jgi:hypothetical protein
LNHFTVPVVRINSVPVLNVVDYERYQHRQPLP